MTPQLSAIYTAFQLALESKNDLNYQEITLEIALFALLRWKGNEIETTIHKFQRVEFAKKTLLGGEE